MFFKVTISKFAFVIMVTMLPLLSMAQNKVVTLPTNAARQIEYVQNVSIPAAAQAVLFKKALNWLVGTKTYKFQKINMMDNAYGRLLADGKFIIDNEEVFILITIDVKANRAMLKVTRFDYNMEVGNIPLDNLTNTKSRSAQLLIPKVSLAMAALNADFNNALTKKR